MKRSLGLTAFVGLVALVGLLPGEAAATSVGTYSLGEPVIVGDTARFDLGLTFSSTAGEELAYFSVDVASSDPLLTAGGTDFTAFSFVKTSPLLDSWDPVATFGPGGFLSIADFDTLTGHLAPGSYTLGSLVVDFSGIAPGTDLTVSVVSNLYSVIGTEDPADHSTYEDYEVDYAPGSRTFKTPGGQPGVIPEPITAIGALLAVGSLVGYAVRRRP